MPNYRPTYSLLLFKILAKLSDLFSSNMVSVNLHFVVHISHKDDLQVVQLLKRSIHLFKTLVTNLIYCFHILLALWIFCSLIMVYVPCKFV